MIVGALEIQILSDLSRLRRDMSEASNTVTSTAQKVDAAVRFMRAALASVGGFALAKYFIDTADAVQLMDARLRIATSTEEDFTKARKAAYEISQRNYTTLDSTYKVMSRLNPVVEKMGGSIEYTAAVSEALAAGLRVSGASTQEASSVMIQFSQAMSSGVLRGEEFNSVSENGSRVITALGNQLGKSRGELRKMAEEGKLTADVVGNALVKELEKLRKEAAGMPLTFAAAFQQLQNDVALAINAFNQKYKITQTLAEALTFLRDNLKTIIDAIGTLLTIGAAWVLLFKGVPLVIAGITAALAAARTAIVTFQLSVALTGGYLGAMSAAMGTAAAATFTLTTAVTRLQLALSVLFAAFAGWQLGSWLRENYLEAELAGIAFVNGTLKAWEAIKYGARVAWEAVAFAFEVALGTMRDALAWFLGKFAQGLNAIGLDAAAAKVAAWAAQVKGGARDTQSLSDRVAVLTAEYKSATGTIDKITGEMADYAIQQNAAKKATDGTRGAVKLLAEQEQKAKTTKEELARAEKARVAAALAADSMMREIADAAFERDEREMKAAEDRIRTARQYLEQVEYEVEALKMTTAERAVSNAMRELERQGIVKGTEAYEAYAAKIREAVLKREDVQASINLANEQAAELKRLNEDIGKSLTDSLFRAFESGRNFFSTLWDGIKNMVRSTVLRVLIEPVQKSLTAGITGALSGGAQAAQGGGGLFGMLGQGLGAVSSLGSIFGTGASLTLGGNMAGALGSAGAMMSGGATASGLAMGAGAVAPYVLAAAALYNALKHEATHHVGSVVAGSGTDMETLFGDASRITENFRSETDTALRALVGASTGGLNALSQAFGGGAGGFSAIAKFAADGKDASIGEFMLNQGGTQVGRVGRGTDFQFYGSDGEQAFKDFAKDVTQVTLDVLETLELPAWVKTKLNELGSSAGLEDFQAMVDSILATRTALVDLRDNLQPLGGVFTTLAAAGDEALLSVVSLAGGFEEFNRKVGAYVKDFYTESEQAALQAKQIQETLAGVGIDATTVNTREEFRALVDSINVGTDIGQQQLVALLNVAPQFAEVAKFLAEQEMTFAALLDQAPQVAILETMQAQVEQEASYQARTATQLDMLIEGQAVSTEAIVGAISSLEVASASAQAQVNSTITRLNTTFDRWDDGDSMFVRIAS